MSALSDASLAGRIDVFTRAYIDCALWSSHAEDENCTPLDEVENDLAPEAVEKMIADCAKFQADNSELFAGEYDGAGHDFWLTRNGHGTGFWDRDDDKYGTPENRDALDKAAREYGECDLYIADDELIYAT